MLQQFHFYAQLVQLDIIMSQLAILALNAQEDAQLVPQQHAQHAKVDTCYQVDHVHLAVQVVSVVQMQMFALNVKQDITSSHKHLAQQ